MTEVEHLKKKIEELEEHQKQAYELLKTLQAKETPEAQTPQTPAEAKQLVVIPNEHKIRKFSGEHGDSQLPIEDFIDSVNSALASRGVATSEQAHFILSYLELFEKTELDTPEKIFNRLQKAFGEKRSVPQLLKAFYDRHQKDGETLRSFSHALRAFQSKIHKKGQKSSLTDHDLRDHFVDNVRDDLLKKELKKLLRTHPDVSFLDVREEAIRWAEEDEKPHESRPRMVSSREITTSSQPPSLATTMNEIMKTLQGQQKAIADLTANIKMMNTKQQDRRPPAQTQFHSRPQPQFQRPSTGQNADVNRCFRCGATDHFARNCPATSRPPPLMSCAPRHPPNPLN